MCIIDIFVGMSRHGKKLIFLEINKKRKFLVAKKNILKKSSKKF